MRDSGRPPARASRPPRGAPRAAKEHATRREDVAVVAGPTEDGRGVRILRRRGDRLELGEARAHAEGKPIHGELVRLRPRADAPHLLDVEVLHDARGAGGATEAAGEAPDREGDGTEPSARPGGRGRPAQVSSEAYRRGWSRLFGARARREGSAAN